VIPSTEELENGLPEIRKSPADSGTVDLIVRRPGTGEREVIESGELDTETGLIGDNWLSRGYKGTSDGSAHPDMQLNLMNSRAIDLIAGSKDRWPLAGDQFFVDMDLSDENLPPGTILDIGTAKIMITSEPHLGCKLFLERFGKDAVKFVNSDTGKKLNLRGVNARVLSSGTVKVGDKISKST
jgi:hypothetical protein